MRKLLLSSIFSIALITCTACTSTSDPLALIEQEQSRAKGQRINKEILMNIQALRTSHKVAMHTYTFVYDLDNKDLNHGDKVTIAKLLAKKHHAIINIAPAKGTNKLHQLTLSMERAEALRLFISHFNNKVKINFAPELSTGTINLVIGA